MKWLEFNLMVGVDDLVSEDRLHGKIMSWLTNQGFQVIVTHEIKEDFGEPVNDDGQ